MKKNNFNILFTCIGRRVSLLKSFQKAAKQLKLDTKIIGADATELSPALQMCDKRYIVESVHSPNYLNQILEIVKKESIKLLVPTTDLDLLVLAKNKKEFEKLGCFVLVSSPNVIKICQDKRKTFDFLDKNGFGTPFTILPEKAINSRKLRYPCFMKPWDGSASRGTAIAHDREELKFYAPRVPNCIVQELIPGDEFTCDVFVDMDGKARCVVPRKRIEVRSGEVSKGEIVKNDEIISQTKRVVETLKAGPGVITVQLMKSQSDGINFIEINPRFGGGAPLSIKAGANFPLWTLKMTSKPNEKLTIKENCYKDRLTMLRYDAEVWI